MKPQMETGPKDDFKAGPCWKQRGSCFQVETSANRNLSDSDSAKLCLMLEGGKGKYKISTEKMFPRPSSQFGQQHMDAYNSGGLPLGGSDPAVQLP
jgi:hypothetical protein